MMPVVFCYYWLNILRITRELYNTEKCFMAPTGVSNVREVIATRSVTCNTTYSYQRQSVFKLAQEILQG